MRRWRLSISRAPLIHMHGGAKIQYENMIKAFIFDMDGLLIDSEPIWQEAEKLVFGTVGFSLTSEEMRQTMGLKVSEVVEHWYAVRPWSGVSKEYVTSDIVDAVISIIKKRGIAMPGVQHAIGVCRQTGLPLAIASSSFYRIIDTVVDKLGIRSAFSVIHSAEDEPFGKPHPGVYISAAKKLGVNAEYCVAFEDSPNGVVSAKAARMRCIAVPDAFVKNDKRFLIADAVLGSLNELTPKHLSGL